MAVCGRWINTYPLGCDSVGYHMYKHQHNNEAVDKEAANRVGRSVPLYTYWQRKKGGVD